MVTIIMTWLQPGNDHGLVKRKATVTVRKRKRTAVLKSSVLLTHTFTPTSPSMNSAALSPELLFCFEQKRIITPTDALSLYCGHMYFFIHCSWKVSFVLFLLPLGKVLSSSIHPYLWMISVLLLASFPPLIDDFFLFFAYAAEDVSKPDICLNHTLENWNMSQQPKCIICFSYQAINFNVCNCKKILENVSDKAAFHWHCLYCQGK